MEQLSVIELLKKSVIRRFNLRLDQAAEEEVMASITRNSDFVGANLWTLIFAILIASIGLNMNSTAVIIGAMLISPLMGPVMGVGFGIGTNNFGLVKKGLRNLIIATLISIGTSTIYFWITPIDNVQSELLARTTPSVWDVFIAFFGGLAGIVAATRKEKNNVIPGVAIATALMPPLCTAGFGLATGQWYFFLGALYLYCINSIFICISTFLIIRLMKFRKMSFENKSNEKRVSRYILLIIVITVLPSIYITYGIVRKSMFENSAREFVKEQFIFKNTLVLSNTYNYNSGQPVIDLLLAGKELPRKTIDSLRQNLKNYGLENTKLVIRQGLSARKEMDISQLKASILQDVLIRDSLYLNSQAQSKKDFPNIMQELKMLYPSIQSYALSNSIMYQADPKGSSDTLTLAVMRFSKPLRAADRLRLSDWLKTRLNADSLKLVLE